MKTSDLKTIPRCCRALATFEDAVNDFRHTYFGDKKPE